MVQEFPSVYGIIGVSVVVIGAYLLNISSAQKNVLAPFLAIFRERGSWFMLTVAFLYSITANFGKMGIQYSNPTFFAATYYTLLSFILLIVLVKDNGIATIWSKKLVLIGLLSSLTILFHMLALKLVFVSYMISVKRSSILFSIMYGALFFKEKDFHERIIGGILMIVGIVIITFWG